MGLFNLFKPAKPVLVIDGLSLNESMGMKGKVPPRNQLQVLRRMARFAQREKVQVVVVLSGTPLNKAPAGKKFEGMTILYSKKAADHAKFLAKTAAGKGAGAILVSGNSAAEKLAGRAVKKMRVSTFRKAFDVGGDAEVPERNEPRRNNRPPRRRSQQKPAAEPKPERPAKEMSDADAINELIDLVD
jgi:hypothetical protein